MTSNIDILGSVERAKREYANKRVNWYKPSMIFITDGMPTDDPEKIIPHLKKEIEKEILLNFFRLSMGNEVIFSMLGLKYQDIDI